MWWLRRWEKRRVGHTAALIPHRVGSEGQRGVKYSAQRDRKATQEAERVFFATLVLSSWGSAPPLQIGKTEDNDNDMEKGQVWQATTSYVMARARRYQPGLRITCEESDSCGTCHQLEHHDQTFCGASKEEQRLTCWRRFNMPLIRGENRAANHRGLLRG